MAVEFPAGAGVAAGPPVAGVVAGSAGCSLASREPRLDKWSRGWLLLLGVGALLGRDDGHDLGDRAADHAGKDLGVGDPRPGLAQGAAQFRHRQRFAVHQHAVAVEDEPGHHPR